SSLFAGISGLASSGKQLDVIANNIANVNTVGFKSGKIHFGDILSQSVTGGSAAGMQVGRGVEVSGITTQFSSGSFETTANATDVAIDGDGFFIVEDADGGRYYTRAGSFSLDSNKDLVDVNSFKVQGYNLTGTNPDIIDDISLGDAQSDPEATTEISIGANLDSDTATGETFNASQTVYDSLGTVHALKLTFQNTEGTGYWGFKSYLNDVAATEQTYSGLKFNTDGVLDKVYHSTATALVGVGNGGTGSVTTPPTYDNRGQLYQDGDVTLTYVAASDSWTIASPEYTNATVATASDTLLTIDLDGAGGKDMTLTLGGAGSTLYNNNDTIVVTVTQSSTEVSYRDVALTMPEIVDDGDPDTEKATIGDSGVVSWDLEGTTAQNVTGYASTSVIRSLVHDGYSSGSLKSISVTQDGIISGFFTNGQTSDIAQIILASFPNTGGLKRMGKNLFSTTVESGSAVNNPPGTAGMGDISPNSLEMSNTDIATEFINMITAQRAY
ncbi:MAG: flagellar hook-basal body complex protein, partial [Methanophagales archaeon]|nr:flagellar hook-basal body complex protein [Methanophagales archaeon]